jgi:hypothetical protein
VESVKIALTILLDSIARSALMGILAQLRLEETVAFLVNVLDKAINVIL